jgi:hypothetical protein
MSIIAVIAKYKEDISWVNQLKCPYIVYDKSNDIPNVGRESETYLRYIIANYEKLPNYILFLQGHPFDHLTIRTVDYINESIDKILDNNIDFLHLNNLHHEPHNKYTRTKESFIALFNHTLPNIFIFPPGAQFIVSRDSILSRSKEFYQTISNVMSKINNTSVSFKNCLVCPWTIERMWSYIFNKSIINNNISYDDLL